MTTEPIDIHLPVLPTGKAASVAMDALEPLPLAASESQPSVADAMSATVGDEPAAPVALAPATHLERKQLEGKVIEAIRTIYDPEIPVNIHELGLIYEVDVKEDRSVFVKMTLTAPACPVAGTLPGQVETRIEEIPEVTKANVELVWDPPWSRDMMSEAAQLQLGFM